MTCPLCGASVDASKAVRNVVICAACLRSLVIEDDGVRAAHGTDTTALSSAELAALKAVRKSARSAT